MALPAVFTLHVGTSTHGSHLARSYTANADKIGFADEPDVIRSFRIRVAEAEAEVTRRAEAAKALTPDAIGKAFAKGDPMDDSELAMAASAAIVADGYLRGLRIIHEEFVGVWREAAPAMWAFMQAKARDAIGDIEHLASTGWDGESADELLRLGANERATAVAKGMQALTDMATLNTVVPFIFGGPYQSLGSVCQVYRNAPVFQSANGPRDWARVDSYSTDMTTLRDMCRDIRDGLTLWLPSLEEMADAVEADKARVRPHASFGAGPHLR